VGGPETDASGERGLHGLASNLPAEIESIVQPDPAAGQLEMRITGKVRQTQVFGPHLELRRTIAGTLGEASIRIHDEVINRGNASAPHMLLYHVNLGWPLADEGAELRWRGAWQSPGEKTDASIFREGHAFRRCPAPLSAHGGGGEEVAFIDITPNGNGRCVAGLHNPHLGIALALRFRKDQLPWLINWQHWGKGEYVTGLEPATHPPIGQAKAREQGTLIHLEPGESRTYELEIEVLRDEQRIQELLQLTQPIH
jgi:galactose mutarotase-like enzyme